MNRKRLALLFCPLLSCLALLAGCGGSQSLPPGTGYMVEHGDLMDAARGHVLLLRGINVREDAKYHEDHLLPLSDGEIDLILESGFNSARLLTGWAAVMPEQGEIDGDYLERLVAEAEKLAAAGLFVVVDMHQDVWGHPFGNGAPHWACPQEIKEGYEPTSPWWANYFSEQVTGCFDNFWENSALQDDFVAAWQEVARRVCHVERLVGFDLLNEPYPGSALGDMDFDQAVLYPFYQKVMDAIGEVCPDRVFFLEPSRAYDFGMAQAVELRSADRPRVVIAPHFYPVAVHEAGEGYDGDARALRQDLEDLYGEYDTAGVPLWFGEFGGLTDNPNFDTYLEDVYTIFNDHFWASALWAFSKGAGGFSLLDENGDRKPVFDSVAAAPVPVLLPSRPSSFTVDYEQPGLSTDLKCKNDLLLQILLPAAGKWTVSFEPPGSLTQPEVEGHWLTAACRGEGQVSFEVTLDP